MSGAAGAVEAVGVDAGVPWHFGDPLGEQRVLSTGAGVVDRSNRGVLRVSGPDRLAWLHSISSQHLSELGNGASTQNLVLSPHGHVEQHWQVTELDGTVWLDVEPGTQTEVLAYLTKMVFLRRVELSDDSADWAVLSVQGPETAAVVAAAGTPSPEPLAQPLDSGGFVRRSPVHPDTVDLVVPRSQRDQTVARLVAAGARPVGSWAFDALRVERRIPRFGQETDHRTIPHEVGWIGTAVHLNKGCYRGQETVARVHNLGRPPRRLVLLHLAGESDVLPEAGIPVEFAGRPVGFLGTAVHHHELGPIALAVIKRSVPDDAELTVEGAAARVDG